MTTRWKLPGTAIAAAAWIAVCSYLYFAWPSLEVLLGTLDPPEGRSLVRVPRVAFLAVALLTVLGLVLKDRCLRVPMALVIDAVVGAPAFAGLALLLQPFFVSVE